MDLHIDIAIATTVGNPPSSAQIQRWVGAALAAGDSTRRAAEISVRLVDDEESRALNHQYRHQNKPTNVLSFPADLPAELGLPLLGDLVVCAPVVTREATEQGKSPDA